jgi:hypothetical protein
MWRCEKLDGVRFNYPADKLAKWYLLPASVRPLPYLLPSPLLCIICAQCAPRLRHAYPSCPTSSDSAHSQTNLISAHAIHVRALRLAVYAPNTL